MWYRWPVVAVGLVGGGCKAPAGQDPMWHRFDAATDAHESILRGDLEGLRAAATRLALAPSRELPPGADSLDRRLRRDARALTDTRSIDDAAGLIVAVLNTCGDCHETFGPGPRFTGRGMPPGGGVEAGREMRRHAWAARRLWEGLVGPSDSAWVAGTGVLADAWMMPEWLSRESDGALVVRSLESSLRALGEEGADAPRQDRATLYAEMIRTCAHCHQMVRRAPG